MLLFHHREKTKNSLSSMSVPGPYRHGTSGELHFCEGRYSNIPEYLGGFTVVDVSNQESAQFWAGKLATACGWPQEVRPLHV